MKAVTAGFYIRRYIFSNQRASLDHHMFADMHKLMDSGHSSQNRKIVYDHFTRQLTGIGDDTIITDLTVMSDMGISHNQTIIPDFSNSLSSSAPINSHTFADSRIISDFYNGLFTSEFQILGTAAITAPGKILQSYRYGHLPE